MEDLVEVVVSVGVEGEGEATLEELYWVTTMTSLGVVDTLSMFIIHHY
jgi:hypothetical protein